MHGSFHGVMLPGAPTGDRAATFEVTGIELRLIATAARCHTIVPPSAQGKSRSDSPSRARHETSTALKHT